MPDWLKQSPESAGCVFVIIAIVVGFVIIVGASVMEDYLFVVVAVIIVVFCLSGIIAGIQCAIKYKAEGVLVYIIFSVVCFVLLCFIVCLFAIKNPFGF